jgi:hypothetical protein
MCNKNINNIKLGSTIFSQTERGQFVGRHVVILDRLGEYADGNECHQCEIAERGSSNEDNSNHGCLVLRKETSVIYKNP